MPKEVSAILLDTRGIQKYVFSCNELKTNVGASYIVDRIFTDLMCKNILPNQFAADVLELDWENNPQIKMAKDDSIQCEVVYIGGGNMLILVNDHDVERAKNKCLDIVKAWSKQILLMAPGLKTGAAIGRLDISESGFKRSLDKLYVQLKANQNNILPNVDLPYTGLTKECNISGKTADAFDKNKGSISSEVLAKIEACRYSTQELQEEYKDLLKGEFDFANDFEKIGYQEGESYLSVIHIDGNNMGVKFSACETLQERKELSKQVQENVKKAFKSLLSSIVKEYDSYKNYLNLRVENKKKLLPIRPIIIGGDDVTFVCPGRLGIEYAKRFVEAMAELPLLTEKQHTRMEAALNQYTDEGAKTKKLSKKLSCCAGVAIVKASYPFFRAYELSEQLCSAAKKNSREDDTSWLDFAILHGEKTPELAQLRRQQYESVLGDLHFGPYKVDAKYDGHDGLNSLLRLEQQINGEKSNDDFIRGKKEARNKIKKLRDVLTSDMHTINVFLQNVTELKKVVQNETQKEAVTAEDFWETKNINGEKKKATRYIDAIEIMDFMPRMVK